MDPSKISVTVCIQSTSALSFVINSCQHQKASMGQSLISVGIVLANVLNWNECKQQLFFIINSFDNEKMIDSCSANFLFSP